MTAQFSVACGLPLSVILLKGLPTGPAPGSVIDDLAPLYAFVMGTFGLLISWYPFITFYLDDVAVCL